MGAVYLGERMEQFSQFVAIKVLHPQLLDDAAESAIEREAQVLAVLDHPGIVRVLDLGVTASGLRYIVMEYVDGSPLDIFCDQHRLSLGRRMAILDEIFNAVEYAHQHLVVHADLKPENILVTADEKPRLLDFGVATILSELGASGIDSSSYTTLYASPEQRLGERLTVASDVYSLGLIAQRILAGVSPEAPSMEPVGDDAPSIARADSIKPLMQRLMQLDRAALQEIADRRSMTSEALLHAMRGDVAAILAKALRERPGERFQGVQEMRDEFNRHFSGYPIFTRPTGWINQSLKWVLRNRMVAALAGVFALVLFLSAFGVVFQEREAARKRELAQTRLHDLVRLTDLLAGDLYESIRGLQGSEAAQAALLTSAHETVRKLSAEVDHDSQLQLELAQAYEKLARLELSLTPMTPEAVQQAGQDLTAEAAMLSQLSGKDPQVKQLLRGIPEVQRLEAEAAARLKH